MILTRKVALAVAGVATAGVLGTAGVAAATATDSPAAATVAGTAPSSTAPSSTAPSDTAAKHRKARAAHGLLARGMHGEWVVKGKDGKPVTLVSVRGSVTAVGPTSVTVKAEDGYTATFVANADTKVKGADVDAISDVKVGAKGAVVGVKNGTTLTARTVLVRK